MRLILVRLLVGAVLLLNLQAALAFLITPQAYAAAYELGGEAGLAALRGAGLLFLMWNVPYAAALWQPQRNRLALILACVMQAIGLLGESWIYLTLSPAHAVLRSSIVRFILFDALGLLALLAADWLARKEKEEVYAGT